MKLDFQSSVKIEPISILASFTHWVFQFSIMITQSNAFNKLNSNKFLFYCTTSYGKCWVQKYVRSSICLFRCSISVFNSSLFVICTFGDDWLRRRSLQGRFHPRSSAFNELGGGFLIEAYLFFLVSKTRKKRKRKSSSFNDYLKHYNLWIIFLDYQHHHLRRLFPLVYRKGSRLSGYPLNTTSFKGKHVGIILVLSRY